MHVIHSKIKITKKPGMGPSVNLTGLSLTVDAAVMMIYVTGKNLGA